MPISVADQNPKSQDLAFRAARVTNRQPQGRQNGTLFGLIFGQKWVGFRIGHRAESDFLSKKWCGNFWRAVPEPGARNRFTEQQICCLARRFLAQASFSANLLSGGRFSGGRFRNRAPEILTNLCGFLALEACRRDDERNKPLTTKKFCQPVPEPAGRNYSKFVVGRAVFCQV